MKIGKKSTIKLSRCVVTDEIIKETKNDKVFVKKLDLSSQKSVRDFAADINKSEQKIDVLIHNAGYAETFNKYKTEDGIEMTMATNHYGPFLLTHLLIDLLKKSSPCRIVIVASELYRFVTVDLKKHINPIGILPGFLYYVSKGCNIMFGIELSKRLKTSGITVNMLHPGMIDSGIWRNVPFPLSVGMGFLIKGFFKTPTEGAQTTIFLACSDEVKDVTGKYFYDCKEQTLQPYIIIPQEHKMLWEESAKMVKLSDADPKIWITQRYFRNGKNCFSVFLVLLNYISFFFINRKLNKCRSLFGEISNKLTKL